jgi:hypothetical protein
MMQAMSAALRPDGPNTPVHSRRRLLIAAAGGLVAGCGGGGGSSSPPPSGLPTLPRPPVVPVDGPAWSGFASNAQHSALAQIAAQSMVGFYWYTPLDLAPQLSNGSLLTHYGSPAITRHNTVVLPVKTGATDGFRVDARVGATGDLLWSLASDYILPPHRWIPSFNPLLTPVTTLLPAARLLMPMSGGRVLLRDNPDAASGAASTLAFYGNPAYVAAPAAYDTTVFINTPLTSDAAGNVFFGFTVTGNNPAPGPSSGGIARIGTNGAGTFVTATTATGDANFVKTMTNSAPALSLDGSTVYVVFNTVVAANARASGRLVALDATTLALKNQVALVDPATGTAAWVSDDATSSPLVGPDGDVYIGVLESASLSHNFRGWLLHFNAALTQARTPGSFGWDNTPSIVPKAMVPQYTGSSSYLLLTKYNNYLEGGGDGKNRVAILDPNNQTQADPITPTVTVMKEIITQLGPTPEAGGPAGSVREWCVNTAAVDPFTSSVLINSEDGTLYRWHLPSNSFSERIALNAGVAQSYTPTAIGPDGRIYAVNNAILHSIGQ